MYKEIESIKRKNGNMNIPQKDMIWYIINKVDKIDSKLDSKVSKAAFRWSLGIIFALIVSLIAIMVGAS